MSAILPLSLAADDIGIEERTVALSQLAFTFVDIDGNTLQFNSLRYERPGASGSDGEMGRLPHYVLC
jgi:hypothetical protein